jgi:hypothetical protein
LKENSKVPSIKHIGPPLFVAKLKAYVNLDISFWLIFSKLSTVGKKS